MAQMEGVWMIWWKVKCEMQWLMLRLTPQRLILVNDPGQLTSCYGVNATP